MGTAGGIGLDVGARERAPEQLDGSPLVRLPRRRGQAVEVTPRPGPQAVEVAPSRSRAAAAVAVAMFAIGIVMWTLAPAAIFWAAPRVFGQPSWLMALELAAVVGEMLLLGSALSRLDVVHCRLTSASSDPCRPQAWARPFSNPGEGRRAPRMLDWVVTVSATSAVITLLVWWLVAL